MAQMVDVFVIGLSRLLRKCKIMYPEVNSEVEAL